MNGIIPDLSLAAQTIAGFEGFKPRAYLDSGGIPTIGYGTIHYPNGHRVTLNDAPVTPTLALVYLENDLKDCALHLWAALTKQPNKNQWAAMLSLAYNIGWPAIIKSGVVRAFNVGDVLGAANHFLDWDKAHVDGVLHIIPGLLNRRKAEQTLFEKAPT